MASSEAGYGDRFVLTLVTRDPEAARAADTSGVDRIGIDIERLAKGERQAPRGDSRISDHQLEDLARLKPALRRARLFCRLDPPHPGTADQVERALALGAEVLMLPHFREISDAARFASLVAGRAETLLLVETAAAAWLIEALAALQGVDEIMIGLNDLAWDSGVSERFQLLASPIMRAVCETVRASGKRLSVGGLGRWDDASLPTSPDLVLAQYPRLGVGGAWLARSFLAGLRPEDLPRALAGLRGRLDHWAVQDGDALEAARRALAASPARVREVHAMTAGRE